MNDPEIRGILIAYLESQGKEVRIYNEKSIGNAICDVLAVGEDLVGCEIKSDCDGYRRLKRQIRMYDLFFDRNYIVVGASHAASAAGKVPAYWGIICVGKEGLAVQREAAPVPSVSRRSQLSLLWGNELRNILKRNDLPRYPRKGKSFIAGKIAEKLDDRLLGREIAEALRLRDYSIFKDHK